MSIWDTTVNSDSSIDFGAELNKDIDSLGSGKQDFERRCAQHKIVICPNVQFDEVSCKVMNCAVDISNWRAMLLACGTANSKICEIVVHNGVLTPKHILDLAALLEKLGTIAVVKLDYIFSSLEEGENRLSAADLRPIFSSAALIEYISLQGNGLDDEFIALSTDALRNNFTLASLNLAGNRITDRGFCELMGLLPHHTSLKRVSLKRNLITGAASSLDSLLAIICGRNFSPDDDQRLKTTAKLIADRNKSLKDLNKKRKKSGLPEFSEIAAPNDRNIKCGTESLLALRSLSVMDLSFNPIDLDALMRFLESLSKRNDDLLNASVPPCQLSLILRGMSGTSERNFLDYVSTYMSNSSETNYKLLI